ncbi:unnamed protein product [Lampetra planeri]
MGNVHLSICLRDARVSCTAADAASTKAPTPRLWHQRRGVAHVGVCVMPGSGSTTRAAPRLAERRDPPDGRTGLGERPS